MVEGGVCIFFADPVPPELEEVAVIHEVDTPLDGELRPGDTLVVGESTVTITAVGERAGENLRTLGHMVVYADPAEGTNLLPGAIHVRGAVALPPPGAEVGLHRTSS